MWLNVNTLSRGHGNPGTLECNPPDHGMGGVLAEFRPVTVVQLLHDVWPGQGVGEIDLDVNGKMLVVAVVLSDLEGTFRVVQG